MLVDRQMQSEITPVTAQVDFEVDCPPPADSPPGDLLITMVKEMVNLFKKEFRPMQKVKLLSLSLI